MWEQVDRKINQALGRVRQAFRGVINLVSTGSDSQMAQISGMADETIDAELFQQFGFTSNPPAGTAVVVLPLGGRTGHGIIVATENGSYRVSGLAPGETAIFNAFGDVFEFKDGKINGTTKTFTLTATDNMKFDTPNAEFTGQVVVQQQLSGNGGMAIQGGDGASFSGSVSQTGGDFTTDGTVSAKTDVKAGSISLTGHHHIAQGPTSPTSEAQA